MTWILPLLSLSLVAWVAWRAYQMQPIDRKFIFWPALSLKVVAGMVLGGLYFFHYRSGDTISYWQDGVRLAGWMLDSPGEGFAFLWDESTTPSILSALQQQTPRSLFFVKICGLLALVSGGNYWMMATWLSVVGFAAAWHLFVRIAVVFPSMRIAAAVAILFFPSVVFWSSGLIKESLGLASIFVLMAGGIALYDRKRISAIELVLLALSLWIGWNLKYYWLGIFIPVLAPMLAVQVITVRFPKWARFAGMLWLVLFFGILLIATNLHPNFHATRFLEVIYQNNLEFTRLSEPPKLVQYLDLEDTPSRVLLNAPAALLAGLFRPFVWESFNLLSFLASLENLIILVLVIQAIPSLASARRSSYRVIVLALLVYVVVLVSFLALSTPNFGTLSRYRIGALPALVILCLNPLTPMGRRLVQWFG